MTISLNNSTKDFPADTSVATLVKDSFGQTAGIAVALNDHIVRRAAWDETILHDGDSVVIIKAAYGG